MKSLIFVYNAKSDIINATFDYAHKIISPNTYCCELCKLTHGNFGEKKLWKEFRENSNNSLKFYHKDEFEELYPNATFSYPIVLEEKESNLTELIATDILNNLTGTEELILLMQSQILV